MNTDVKPVLFETLALTQSVDCYIGKVHLNAPTSFNALNLDMVQLMSEQLLAWQNDNSIVAVFIDAEGDKAFCAGGDVKGLYEGRVDSESEISNPSAVNFFDQEYDLDYLIHCYSKPIICWGHGIVMGGGIGVMVGCDYRIVTERSRMAMPEITIGLFPDVGGSWFLNRSPGRTGLFLGLTGANINAHDAIYAGLADRFVEHSYKDDFLLRLSRLSVDELIGGEIGELLKGFEEKSKASLPTSELKQHYDLIQACTNFDLCVEQLPSLVKSIVETCAQQESDWLKKAGTTLAGGCPITAHLVAQQLKRARYLSLREVFDMERKISSACMAHPDFYEGVRALLVDKDKNPQWTFTNSGDVTQSFIDNYFA